MEKYYIILISTLKQLDGWIATLKVEEADGTELVFKTSVYPTEREAKQRCAKLYRAYRDLLSA